MKKHKEAFISIDVETAGPIPGEYSMLSLGACLVSDPLVTFDCQFQPLNDNAVPAALEISGLSLDKLKQEGLEPATAMQRLEAWISQSIGSDEAPVFVGFNAPFDWSFVNYYFHRFTGANPFGFTALDIKALYMGVTGCTWSDTRSSKMAAELEPKLKGDHDALHDAQYQAELFRLVLKKQHRAFREGQ